MKLIVKALWNDVGMRWQDVIEVYMKLLERRF